MMRQIIGVVGLIGSGKDTIGHYLVETKKFKRDSFAEPLKDIVAILFNWDRNLLDGITESSRKWREAPDEWWEFHLKWHCMAFAKFFPRFSPRVALQIFGSELLRNRFHQDIWMLSLNNRLQAHDQNVVVTDCRFHNECDLIKSLGGKIVKVIRGVQPQWVNYVTCRINSNTWDNNCLAYMSELGIHVSEWSMAVYKCDYYIHNNGTIDELYSSIEQLEFLNQR